MTQSEQLLENIEECLNQHGGDLGGWTRLSDDCLQIFDGRVSLKAKTYESNQSREGVVHVHVLATLHEHEDEVLDACVVGVADDSDAAVREAAFIWVTSVAGPIRSFLDGKPVCMSCQAGVADGDTSQGYVAGDYGLPGLRAFVGPAISRFMDESPDHHAIDDTKPWFRFAAEAAAPRRIHLAKATLSSKGKEGWIRLLEIDGHDVSYQDPSWPADSHTTSFGYLTRFAVFEFPRNSSTIKRRAELERTIREFAERFIAYESIDSLMEEMVAAGFDPDLVHDVEAISTIAFGRAFFAAHDIQYSPTIIRAMRDGRIETDVPLMSLPAYTRAKAIAEQLRESLPQEHFQALCFYNAESNAILQAIERNGPELDLRMISLYPSVVPDRGVSQQTMNAATAALQTMINRKSQSRKAEKPTKPWWKFWR